MGRGRGWEGGMGRRIGEGMGGGLGRGWEEDWGGDGRIEGIGGLRGREGMIREGMDGKGNGGGRGWEGGMGREVGTYLCTGIQVDKR